MTVAPAAKLEVSPRSRSAARTAAPIATGDRRARRTGARTSPLSRDQASADMTRWFQTAPDPSSSERRHQEEAGARAPGVDLPALVGAWRLERLEPRPGQLDATDRRHRRVLPGTRDRDGPIHRHHDPEIRASDRTEWPTGLEIRSDPGVHGVAVGILEVDVQVV